MQIDKDKLEGKVYQPYRKFLDLMYNLFTLSIIQL